jgi:hypothetical protein
MAARKAGLTVREEPGTRVKAARRDVTCTDSNPCAVGEGGCQNDKDCAGGLFCFVTVAGASPPGVDASEQDASLNFCTDPARQSAYLGLGIKEYYDHFLNVVADFLHRGTRLLKIDGVGNPAGQEHTMPEDFDAAVSMAASLRRISRSIFINLSTGTWSGRLRPDQKSEI